MDKEINLEGELRGVSIILFNKTLMNMGRTKAFLKINCILIKNKRISENSVSTRQTVGFVSEKVNVRFSKESQSQDYPRENLITCIDWACDEPDNKTRKCVSLLEANHTYYWRAGETLY